MTSKTFTLTFQDERDFVLAASGILGAAYVNSSDAAQAINNMPLNRSYGSIRVEAVTPTAVATA